MRDPRKVLDVSDLSEVLHSDFFDSRAGRVLGNWLLDILNMEDINSLVMRHDRLSGAPFAEAILKDPAVSLDYEVEGTENLDSMRGDHPFITVSNHPFGGLDGLMLVSVIGSVRPDYKVVVNDLLDHIAPLRDSWISVSPIKASDHEAARNVSSLFRIGRRIKEGHPVGFFPAGTVAEYNFAQRRPVELDWSENSMRIFRGLRVPIYPIAFSGRNSFAFYLIQKFFDKLHGLRLPTEILNKREKKVKMVIGKPLTSEDFKGVSTHATAAAMLRDHTLSLLGN